MHFVTEEQNDSLPALCVLTKRTPLISALKTHFEKFGIKLIEKDALPESVRPYQYIFIFYDTTYGRSFFKNLSTIHEKIIVITHERKVFKQLELLARTKEYQNLRVINVDPHETQQEYIEKIIWFSTTKTEERGINLEKVLEKETVVKKNSEKRFRFPRVTRKRGFIIGLFLFLCFEVFFVVPLGISGYFLMQAAQSLEKQQFVSAQRQLRAGKPFLHATQISYSLARPALSFFFITLLPENLIQIDRNGYKFVETALNVHRNSTSLFPLLLNAQKTPDDIKTIKSNIQELKKDLSILSQTSGTIKDTLTYKNARIQKVRAQFEEIYSFIETSKLFLTHADAFLAEGTTKNYIIFFYNNMEIRPGGGFIGSFAHVVFENYTLKDFKVYDVYDADGQLTAHVEPPKAIRLYLSQPHWFLRDSNFSPDFEQNVKTAEYFLEKELGLRKFDGAIGITTTAISYILGAFGDVYIPDFDETVNKDNFYLKAQAESEKNFFPGSKQKKNYLSAIGKTLFLQLESASPLLLAKGVRQSFDEKHAVLLMRDTQIQKDFDTLHWSGKTIYPQCALEAGNCIINHIMPIDANMGVNKANYFVSKYMHLVSRIRKDGSVENQLTISFTNNSAANQFPGGTYVNYFQLYLPHGAIIGDVEFDGTPIEDFSETKSGLFKIFGTLIEIPPKKSSYLHITYVLKSKAKTGENIYQVVVQKQIGAFNSDFAFEVYFPDNMIVTDQNFKSLAKNNSVGYNSSLSTDKIFVIQFIKE